MRFVESDNDMINASTFNGERWADNGQITKKAFETAIEKMRAAGLEITETE